MKIYGYRMALIVLLLVSITSVCFAGKSVERLMTDAKSGDAEAQLTLGMRYAAGRGIPQNCSAALINVCKIV